MLQPKKVLLILTIFWPSSQYILKWPIEVKYDLFCEGEARDSAGAELYEKAGGFLRVRGQASPHCV
jgi:hypothetical protein